MQTIKEIVLDFVKGCSKAIAGAVAAAIVVQLRTKGFEIPSGFEDSLSIVGAAMIGFAVVYLSPKNKG